MSDSAASPRSEPGIAARFYRPDGSWSCTRDHVTEPCGDCDGCRLVAAENAASAAIDRPCPACGLSERTCLLGGGRCCDGCSHPMGSASPDNEGLPPGFVPAWTFIKTPEGTVEYEHPAGEAIRTAAPTITPCETPLFGIGMAIGTPSILATCTRPRGHDGHHHADVRWTGNGKP